MPEHTHDFDNNVFPVPAVSGSADGGNAGEDLSDEISEDETDQAEIDRIKTLPDAQTPRSILHSFGAPTREAAQLCTDALNVRFGASGGAANFTGAEIDLTNPDFEDSGDPDHAFQVVFEHEAVVDDAYVNTIHEMEELAERTGVEYNGWEADEGEGIV